MECVQRDLHLIEYGTFSIEVGHILFIIYFVAVKSYKKKKASTRNSSKLENNGATALKTSININLLYFHHMFHLA